MLCNFGSLSRKHQSVILIGRKLFGEYFFKNMLLHCYKLIFIDNSVLKKYIFYIWVYLFQCIMIYLINASYFSHEKVNNYLHSEWRKMFLFYNKNRREGVSRAVSYAVSIKILLYYCLINFLVYL